MFSEYTSKFLSQSQAGSEAPLFHSAAENPDDQESPSLYSSRLKSPNNKSTTRWVSSFANRPGKSTINHPVSEDEDDDDDDDLEPKWQTMESSQSTNNGMDSVKLHHREDLEDEDPPDDLAVEHVSGMKPFVPLDLRRQPQERVDEERGISSPNREPENIHATQSSQQNEYGQPPQVTISVMLNNPNFDSIWATAYIASVSMLLATSVLIWLRTNVPKVPLGDTMYTVLKSSSGSLFTTTLLSIMISCIWIMAMKKYANTVVYLSIVSVPIGLFATTIYSLVSSYRTPDGGFGSQDRAMRWASFAPLVMAGLWCYVVYKGRRALNQSLGIVRLACTMISDNKPLMLLGVGSVGVFLLATIVWTGLFTRVFLQGHLAKNGSLWVLDTKSWLFGIWYILMYLWTWGVISGIQRATTAATISQWYFHRHEMPSANNSMTIVKAALQYSVTAQFGTICLSALIRLLIRLPVLFLPRRIVGAIQMIVYQLMSTSVISVVTPLALTNAVINSQPLVESARTLTSLHQYHPHANEMDHTAYKLSKLILTAGRGLTAVVLGVASWVHAARYTNGGSLYGYAVGLLSGFIGWFVLGATEGVLSTVVDAAFVCHALDHTGTSNGGHCAEADIQFKPT